MAKVTSGNTGLGAGDNWKINVFWERKSYDVDNLTCVIKAQIGLYYWSSEIGNRNGTITINGAKKSVTTPGMNDYSGDHGAGFHYGVYSNWVEFTVPIDDNGDCHIKVEGYLDIKAKYLSNGVWQTYRECGPKEFDLSTVDVYTKVYGGSSNNFSKGKYVYKTTDYGQHWSKCNAYKTTNSGRNWPKV